MVVILVNNDLSLALVPPPTPPPPTLSLSRSLAHSMLERVDSYLWTQRPTAVGPQIVMVQNLDKQLDQSKVQYTLACSCLVKVHVCTCMQKFANHSA